MTPTTPANSDAMRPPRRLAWGTVAYGLVWAVVLVDWMLFHRAGFGGLVETLRAVARWTVFGASIPLGAAWLAWGLNSARRRTFLPALVATVAFVPWWQFAVYAADFFQAEALRAQLASGGTWALYLLGIGWLVWLFERTSRHTERAQLDERLKLRADRDSASSAPGAQPATAAPAPAVVPRRRGGLNWNPLDADAWFYRLAPGDWFNPRRFRRILDELRAEGEHSYGQERRRLNQSLMGLCGYSLAFYMAVLLMTQVGGCSEIYEMPAGGGGPAQTIVQQVKVQKVIKKKFVINPFSAIRFKVPPIDDVKLELTDLTKHMYTIGQGAGGMGHGTGTGSGFFGGTGRGKVRFIRLQYTGGDWDQDFGVGADLNMLIQYGVRTQQKVSNETESRTIAELAAFKPMNSPPFVFMTGQRNISLSSGEVKMMRDYLLEKHGMLFCDNGGSAHFHNQFFAMMNQVLPNVRPVQIPLDDVIHKTPFQIPFLPYVAPHGGREAYGWKVEGRWVAYYHPGDIGDAWSDGHSGVKPEVWEACYQLGTNVIFYAHVEYSKWLEAQMKK